MPGRISNGNVIVEDKAEASQLYNRGWYGTPQSGGSLKMDMLEALYLLETGRLEIVRNRRLLDFVHLFKEGNKHSPSFEIRYLVYRDLRARGYLVKTNGGVADFRVFPRGGTPSKSTSKWWVFAVSERSLFSLASLLSNIDTSKGLRKDILLAIVDEEGDVTYYEVKRAAPSGKRGKHAIKGTPRDALFTGDRVIVSDAETASQLHEDGFYGRMLGDRLQLSLIEAVYLTQEKQLTLRNSTTGRRMTVEQLKRHARKNQRDFALRLAAYEDLKSRGLVVKTGFKYGSHFRAYEGDPNKMHARFLVHAVPEDYSAIWPEISRVIRLAHGVRKEILFCKVGSRDVDYIRISRCRP